MKKFNKEGNKCFTVKQVCDLLPKIQGSREAALKLGEKIGMHRKYIDFLRMITGATAEMHYKTKEEIDLCKKIFYENPGKSVYQLFREFKDILPVNNYQYFYNLLRRNGVDVSRKRFDWTKFKVMALLDCRNRKKMTWKETAAYLGCTYGAAHGKYQSLMRQRKQ